MNNFNVSQNDNSDYKNQGDAVAQTIQDNQTSIINEPGKINPKLKIMKIIIMAVIGILVAGGVAYGAWYAYDNYFASPTLADLILDSAEHLEKIKIYQIDYELDVELANNFSSPFSMLGSDIFGGLLRDGTKQTINLKGYSYMDQSDKENIRSEGNVKLTFGSGMGNLDISNRLTDKILYLKLNDLPTMLSAFVNMDSMGNNWISIDKNQDDGALSKYNDFFEEDEECIKKSKEFVRDFLEKNELYEMMQDCSTEKGESGAVINCQFKIKASVIQDLVRELTVFESEHCKTDNLEKLEDVDWGLFEKVNNDIVYDADFSKKDRYLTKLSVLYKNTQEANNIVKNAVFEVYINDNIEQKTISVPEESIGLEEFIKILFSGFMNNMTGGNLGLLSDDDSLGFNQLSNARSEARDAKRIAGIKQIQTSLELYYNDNEAYPISTDRVVLGEGDYMVLCSNGFYPDICADDGYSYMNIIPFNPEPNGMDYVYSCADGENYEIIFMIENNNGYLKAGMIQASPHGMESVSDPLLYDHYLLKDSKSESDETFDSDNDGLSDQEEEQIYLTDINNPDTDGDGYTDGDEVKNGYNPNGDGLLLKKNKRN